MNVGAGRWGICVVLAACPIAARASSPGDELPQQQDMYKELKALREEVSLLRARRDEPLPGSQEMYEELLSLRQEVAQLRSEVAPDFLTEERAEQVRELVADILADADVRSSLLSDGITAGYDGSFFVGSADGNFLLKIGGQLQARYISNWRQGGGTGAGDDDWEGGFQLRRVKLNFSGHVFSPDLQYVVQFAAERNGGTVQLEDAIIRYRLNDQAQFWGGRFQDTFAREQMMSSKRQQAVDRSAVANIFAANDGYVEGIAAEWKALPDHLHLSLTINDGMNSGTPGGASTGYLNTGNDFWFDSADFACTARADWKIAGEWSQQADVESWESTEAIQAFLGVGFHYELGESGDSQTSATTMVTGPYDSFYIWTVDGLVKIHGVGLMASAYGWHFDVTGANPLGNLNNYAVSVQGGWEVIPGKLEPYLRYEWICVDPSLNTNQLQLVTAGFNYFVRRHNLKFTADVIWCVNNVNSVNTLGTGLTGIGILLDSPGQSNQVVARVQCQLLF